MAGNGSKSHDLHDRCANLSPKHDIVKVLMSLRLGVFSVTSVS